jgi:hypothetical protein
MDVYLCEWSDNGRGARYRLTIRSETGPVWRYVSRKKLDVALKELRQRTVNVRITLLED